MALDPVAEQYAPIVKSIQDRRRKVEDDWLRVLDAWKTKHRRQGFKGEWANYFIPALRRAIEKFVTKTKQMLFPSPDFFEVYPADDQDANAGKNAEAWKSFLLWRLTRCKARSVIVQAVRCFLLYQRAIIKTFLDTEDIPGQIWPSIRCVDPFNFYVWPETATTIAQVQIMFENTMMPVERYNMLVQMGGANPLPGPLTAPEWPYFYTQRLGEQGFTRPTDVPAGQASEGGTSAPSLHESMVSLTELWIRQPGAAWRQIWLVWNTEGGTFTARDVQQVIQPYKMALDRALPGEHYTSSLASDLEPWNVIANDMMNMSLEGDAVAKLPPTVVDPSAVTRSESLVFRARAKWLADPAGISILQTNQQRGQNTYSGVQMALGMLDQASGANSLSEGTPQRGMPRAGFAVSSMINLATADIRHVAETFEDELLTEVLQDMYKYSCLTQNLPQIAQIPGSRIMRPQSLDLASISGAYNFRWVGSLQAQDMQVRAQRMLTLVQTLGKVYPHMRQSGWDIDFGTLGRRLWRDGLGERGADTIFFQAPPPEPPPPPPPPPPKINVSLSGQMDPMTTAALSQEVAQGAMPQPPQPPGQGQPPHMNGGGPAGPPVQRPPGVQGAPPQTPQPVGSPATGAGGGAGRPPAAPGTAENAERQVSRQMSEAAAGPMVA